MKIFNVYDPGAAFPQAARIGEGITDQTNGIHYPPAGMASHEVTNNLPHGVDNEFYETTNVDELTPKSQAEVDAIITARILEQQKMDDRPTNAENRLKTVMTNPDVKAIKTLADGVAYVQANATTLSEMQTVVGQILAVLVNSIRWQHHRDDTMFPDGE